ncbi:MAG: hypothetical protein ACOVNR_10755 [Chitinophagaceae bacterium]
MKTLVCFLVFIPCLLFGQPIKTKTKKLPLIESICTDTVDGKFNQLLFKYDEKSRVIGIFHKENEILTDSSKNKKVVETIIKEQSFTYNEHSSLPVSRRSMLFQYNDVDSVGKKILFLASAENQYFLFEKRKRIGDSSLYLKNWHETFDWDWSTEEPQKRIGKLEQTKKRIYHAIDISKPYSPPTIYSNEFILTNKGNIGAETSAYRYGNRSNDASYYVFQEYDFAINPLSYLNIANTLANEKVSLSLDGQYGKIATSLYFINKHNYVNYYCTTDEITSHYKYIVLVEYNYNQLKLPINAKIKTKQVYSNSGEFVAAYEQRLTFTYKD